MALPTILANFETTLAAKISDTATTATLGRSTDDDGNSLSGIYVLTIDEGTSSEEHVLATLTGAAVSGMTRGLSRVDGSTSQTANKYSHDRGASVKITNFPLVSITRLINGDDQFDADNIMEYDANPSFSAGSNELATIKYADDLAIAGSPDMSTTAKGLAEEATQAEIDAGTGAGGTGARLAVNPSTLATSIYNTQLPSSDEKDALVGTSGTPSTSNKFVTADDADDAATASKIARRDGNGDVLVATTPTDGDAAVSKTYFEANAGDKLDISLTDVTVANTTTETALMSFSLPANTLGTANGVKIEIPITDWDVVSTAGPNSCDIRLKYGATTIATCSVGENSGTFTNFTGKIEAFLFANADTAVQEGSVSVGLFSQQDAGTSSGSYAIGDNAVGTGAEDSTGALTLSVTVEWDSASTNNSITIPHSIVTKISS